MQVPSGFFLADAFLLLDKRLEGLLLVTSDKMTKQDLAAREAKRVKKLMGALRHLFRNSPFALVLCNLLHCMERSCVKVLVE